MKTANDTSPFCPQAAIFDMDGLMLDTERPALALWIQAGRRFGREITPELLQRAIGIKAENVRAVFTGAYGEDFPYDAIHTELERLIHDEVAREGIRLRPGLGALLDCLEERRIPCAVATSTNRKNALWKLEQAGILHRFSAVVCGDEVANGKPAPDIFLAAAARLGVEAAACVGFEDSSPGLVGLDAAGIRPVFVQDIAEPSPEALAVVWRQYETLAEAVVIFDKGGSGDTK